jgi:hypothetical protein
VTDRNTGSTFAPFLHWLQAATRCLLTGLARYWSLATGCYKTPADRSDLLLVSTFMGDFYQATDGTESMWPYSPLCLFPDVPVIVNAVYDTLIFLTISYNIISYTIISDSWNGAYIHSQVEAI